MDVKLAFEGKLNFLGLEKLPLLFSEALVLHLTVSLSWIWSRGPICISQTFLWGPRTGLQDPLVPKSGWVTRLGFLGFWLGDKTETPQSLCIECSFTCRLYRSLAQLIFSVGLADPHSLPQRSIKVLFLLLVWTARWAKLGTVPHRAASLTYYSSS